MSALEVEEVAVVEVAEDSKVTSHFKTIGKTIATSSSRFGIQIKHNEKNITTGHKYDCMGF